MSSKIAAFCRNPGEIIVGKVVSEEETYYSVEDACVLITAASDKGVGFGFLPIDTLNQEPTVLFRTIVETPVAPIKLFKNNLLFVQETLSAVIVNSYTTVIDKIAQMAAHQQIEREQAQVSLFGEENKGDNIVKLFD